MSETPAQMAADDQTDAFVRNALALPFGGLYDIGGPVVVPYLTQSGAMAVAVFQRLGSRETRDCTACLSGALPSGGCETVCGAHAMWRVRIGHTIELACQRCAPDMLAGAAAAIRDVA